MLELFWDFHHGTVSDSFPSILFDPGRRFFPKIDRFSDGRGTGTSERLQPAKGIAASKMITESARTWRFASLSLIDLTSLQIAYPSSKLSRYSWRMSIESESVN
jgi:hypothetical protein